VTFVAGVEPISTITSGFARMTTSTFAVLPRPVSRPSAGSVGGTALRGSGRDNEHQQSTERRRRRPHHGGSKP
jgi:hypothetical protein